jgi:F0F1-type ATP synthase epsilon subunit
LIKLEAMANKLIHLKVRDAQTVIFEGEVDRISSFNEVGPFDIYPMHANFISIIHKKLTLYLNKEKVKEFDFELAVMKVKKDSVKIFVGIETISLDEKLSTNSEQ